MDVSGRNQPCGCGSGLKAKRCCGVRRGPSEADLARSFLAARARWAARVLRRCSGEELTELRVRALELPTLDTSLQLPLPRLLTPDVVRLVDAIDDGDIDGIDEALPDVLARLDTPLSRAELARAVVALRDEGRIDPRVAAVALVELSVPSARALVSSALVQAAGVAAGDVRTPQGLLIAG